MKLRQQQPKRIKEQRRAKKVLKKRIKIALVAILSIAAIITIYNYGKGII